MSDINEEECRQILDRWLFDDQMRICRDRWECLGDHMAIIDAINLLRKYDTWPPAWLVYAVQEVVDTILAKDKSSPYRS